MVGVAVLEEILAVIERADQFANEGERIGCCRCGPIAQVPQTGGDCSFLSRQPRRRQRQIAQRNGL